MSRHIYVCCGLSGSGKTTCLKTTPSSEDIVLSRDGFAKIHGYEPLAWHDFISSELRKYSNRTFFIDQTTDSIRSFERLLKNVEWLKGDEVILLAFHTDLEDCRARVMSRQHGRINKGLEYLYKEDCRNNPLISEDEFNAFQRANPHYNIRWRKVYQ